MQPISSTSRIRFPFIIILGIFAFFYFLVSYLFEDTIINSDTPVRLESPFRHVDSSRNTSNKCALPIYDFWHTTSSYESCDKPYEKWTELVNSTWQIVKEGANCSARCFEGVGASKDVIFQKWTRPGHVDCEFLEAVCYENGTEVYGHIHTQVIRKTTENPETQFLDGPNVFVFTIDSMSTGMAKRSIPKFLEYFQTELSGIEFPFVNKVGENSQPNAYPLWFGKSVEKGRKVSWEEFEVDWNETMYCDTHLDNYTSIFKDFKNYGYTTILLEDWAHTLVDSWPFCKGFKNPAADHIFRPFSVVNEWRGTNATKYHLKGHLCRERHHAVMEHLGKCIEVYRDRPLFSWVWLSEIAHSKWDGVARMEDFLVEYFKKHQKVFDDSFVFFVSDHGFRIGWQASTEIGSFERHNPFLAISIPRRLRNSKTRILETLRSNSEKLQTHFDTRATLMDILKYQPKSDYMDRYTMSIPNEKGNSLIRRQPDFPRTCATLPIPQQYCICQVEKFEIRNETLKSYLGQRLLDHVHQLLDQTNFTRICEKFKFQEVTSLIEYGYSTKWNTYKIAVKTQSPSFAHFETMMTFDDKTNKTNFEKVVRLDRYGNTTDCTEVIRHEPMCFCKE